LLEIRTNLGEEHKWEKSEVLTKFWSENLTVGDVFEVGVGDGGIKIDL